jgi:excisionase family DNA binding protein
MQDGSPGEGWLTLTEAATLLGLSVDTVRRRVKRGELEARMVPTPHGAAWRVRLPSAPTVGATVVQTVGATLGAAPTQATGGPPMGELVGLVGRLHDENRALAEAAATWQTRAELLAAQLEDARAQLALSAPTDGPQSRQDARETASHGGVLQESTPARPAPWWRRWWVALLSTPG